MLRFIIRSLGISVYLGYLGQLCLMYLNAHRVQVYSTRNLTFMNHSYEGFLGPKMTNWFDYSHGCIVNANRGVANFVVAYLML